jgi:parallel beta-helix repeat protein
MNLKVVTLAVLALFVFSIGSLAGETSPSVRVVSNVEELLAVQQVVGNASDTASEPVTIKVLSGRYLLKDSFRIARANVSLIGEPGAIFQLMGNINEPVIAIGTQTEIAGSSDVITDIAIVGLEIDGNKEGQRSEYSARRPWIRNNGIDVRAVTRLKVTNVIANNNRSGGLVISWGCSDVRVTGSTFAKNHFDGIAFYDSKDVDVSDCTMTRNLGAGISLDNEFVDSRFSRCIIESNEDVGIFARSSARLEFKDCTVRQSGSWGFFLGHDARNRGVIDVVITGGQIVGNRGGVWMASVNEKQSRGTRIEGALFSGNQSTGRQDLHSSGSVVAAVGIAGQDAAGKLTTLNLATIR